MNAKQYTDDDGNLWIKTGRVFENQFREYTCGEASVWVSNPSALGWVPVGDTSKFAVYSEVFAFKPNQLFAFKSGPQRLRFYFCEKHKGVNPYPNCFLKLASVSDSAPRIEDPLCEYVCDACRGEDGP